ncbi:hypothetical protein D1007_13826 [Hordeum vulgare]|nr:hypothetical protein D1007_13826 [Hordeum vulgare]
MLFKVMFQKSAVVAHIIGTTRPIDIVWALDDAHIISWLNDITRSLLTDTSMSYSFWVEALNTNTFLLNRRTCHACQDSTLIYLVYGVHPDLSTMRVLGCLCFPNLTATSAHKLPPCSHPWVFLSYSPYHKGYHCLNRNTGRVVVSHHVIFDELHFPFAPTLVTPTPNDDDIQPPPILFQPSRQSLSQ